MLFNIVKFLYCTIDQPQLENNFKYLYDKLASMQKNFGLKDIQCVLNGQNQILSDWRT